MNTALLARLMDNDPIAAGDSGPPVDPEVAAALLVSSVEREIHRRRELIDRIKESVDTLRPDPGAPPNGMISGIEYVVGAVEVRAFLRVAGDACREEVLVLHPCTGGAAGLDEMSRTYLPLLTRGVAVRLVCQHRDRGDLAARMRLRTLTDAGAVVRTVSHVPRAAAVFDRSLAALFGSEGGRASVAGVHDPGVVHFLLDLFDHLWDAAASLGAAESGYAGVADDLRQSIVGLMARGYTDEVVARKLGMSLRTCRRHIAGLMRDLDANSRFQAGVQAARRSLVS